MQRIFAYAWPQQSNLNGAAMVTAMLLLPGCASAPPLTPLPPAVLPTATAVCPSPLCPPCATCADPEDLARKPATPDEPLAVETPRGRLEKTDWQQVPGFFTDDPSDALRAFEQSCTAIGERPEWSAVCALARKEIADQSNKVRSQRFFVDQFEAYRVVNFDGSDTGLVTGYYEPLLRGSRQRSAVYRYPIYSPPQDLISVDLALVYPDLKHRRLRGRVVGAKLIPYLERSEIESKAEPLKGLELAWVDDAVELFFLQIQGSGQIEFADGTRMRVGYADQNGHPFRSVAAALIRRGELRIERASMQGIKAWAAANPTRVQRFTNLNPSYVFFKELSPDLSGPLGTLGVPLTAERSIAVDQRVIPLGVPVFVSTTFPNSKQPLNRLTVAQDTGGAIAGGVRADYFWGFGDAAGALAGRMKQVGRMWVLLPKGYDPDRVATAPPKVP